MRGLGRMTEQPSTGSGEKAVWGTVDKALWTDGRGRGWREEGAGGRPLKPQKHKMPARPYTTKVLGFRC